MSASRKPFPDGVLAQIHRVAARYGVQSLRVFGSFARGQQGPGSDLDLLVGFEKGRGFSDLLGFCDEVEVAVGRPVDVVTEDGLSPFLRDRVLAEAIPL